jgi:outer membrane protein insertion porin family
MQRYNRMKRHVLGLICLLGLGQAAAVRAQPAPAPTTPEAPAVVLRVEVEGNRRVPTQTILQAFAVRPGDVFDPGKISRAVQGLTRKGRFADVRVDGEMQPGGVVLTVVVQEFPRLQEVKFEGSKEIKESDLRAGIHLGPQSFMTPWDLRRDREKMEQMYREKGYFRATVQDTLLAGDNGDSKLVFRITEGRKASVQEIVFDGNAHVPTGRLRKQMKTHEDGVFSGGDLKSDALQEDFDNITKFYGTLGYLDARVARHDLDLAPNGRDLTLRIHIDEGRQYLTGEVTWKGNTVFSDDEIRRQIQLVRGQPFNETAFEATTAAIQQLYQDRGYFYFSATPRKDVHDNVMNLTYDLTEGQQARLNHIRIVGNTKTQDKVILREFVLLPGETFDRSRLGRSLREVFQLGFFEDVNIPPDGIHARDDGSVDLDLRVVERQTGQLGAGAGYSGVSALTGFFEMAETNLFGTGKRLSVRWEFGKHRNDINFSYTHPWFLDTPTTMTMDLFNSSGRSRTNSFYRAHRTGGALRIGRRLNSIDFTTASWRIRAENVSFSDFDPSFPEAQRAQLSQDTRRISSGVTLLRNSTDSPFFPSHGSNAELNVDLFGGFLGGDVNYVRSDVDLAWYQPVGISKITLMLRSQFGGLRPLEGDVVPNDALFRLGGAYVYGVRGYDDFEIVPEGNPPYQGGQAMTVFTAELRYPFSSRVHGALFVDAGNTWNSFGVADFSNLRKGAGVGIRVEVPMLGLLGADYGYGFDRVDSLGRDADSWNFHFRFGNLF